MISMKRFNQSGKEDAGLPLHSFVDELCLLRLCCDREIATDATDLHSRLFDLSQMNHVVVQFNENGHLLADFTRQIDKLQSKSNDISRASTQMPRDAELLEAR